MVRSFLVSVVCPDWCARFTMTFLEVDTCKETQKHLRWFSPVPSISMHFLWKTFHLKPIETVVPCFNWECMRRPRTVLARLLLHRPFHTPVLSKPVPDCLARMDSEEKLGGLPLSGWLKWFEIVILGRNPNLKYPKQTQLIISGTCWMIPKKWIESSPWTYFWVSCHFF